jgi:hypothetical protein
VQFGGLVTSLSTLLKSLCSGEAMEAE